MARIIFFFLFITGIDIYAFSAFENLFPQAYFLPFIYFSATAIMLAGVFIYFNFRLREQLHIPRQAAAASMFILFIPKLFLALFMLAEDVVRVIKLVINIVLRFVVQSNFQFGVERSLPWSWIALGVTGLLMFAFIYGALFNVYNYKLRKVHLKLLKLPKAFNGLKVVQISDIHSGSLSDKKAIEKAVHRINALNPDLIFFTGDLVNNIAVEALDFTEIFSKLHAKFGVYSILGNHDYGDYMYWQNKEDKIKNLELLKNIHEKMGWKLLMNEHIFIEKEGDKIFVAGVENWSASRRFPKYGKLQKALDGIQHQFTVLLLSHDPSHWKGEILDHPAQIDVTFSGHTHGMQFGIEIFNFKWSPVKYFYKQWAGLYENAGQYLYVNRGFGVLGYPGRIGILPEITLFTLHSAN